MTIGLFSLRIRFDVSIALKRRVNDPSLIGIHRLESDGLVCTLHFISDIAGQVLECIRTPSAIVLGIELDARVIRMILVGW